MNFDSILIISYGRSGSTLLQGILNSHEEVLVRGENFNFCQGLYKSHVALIKTKRYKLGTSPTNPFFGSVFLDEAYFLSMCQKMVKNLLFGDQIGNEKIKCYGFKEIRYQQIPGILDEYLNFLKCIFPNPAFIINTRNKDDVLRSREKINWKGEISMEALEGTEEAFFDFIDKNPDCTFHVTYEDVISKTEKLSLLHSFLGLSYSEEQINRVLSLEHSNTLRENEAAKLKSLSEKTDEESEEFTIVSLEERHLAQLEKELLLKEQEISNLKFALNRKASFSFRSLLSSFMPFLKKD